MSASERDAAIGRLPEAEPQPPACGCCGDTTEAYGDGDYLCDDCGLWYNQHLIASYTDDDAQPCAKPCPSGWHRPGIRGDRWEFVCGTCALPAGHAFECWTGCRLQLREVTP